MSVSDPRTICVDLNGTLDTYTGWRGPHVWFPPRPGAARFLAALRDRGFRVVILTTRDVTGTWAWLHQHGLAPLVDDVTNQKIPAIAYVDDRAVRFTGDYDAVLRALEHFHPYWEPAPAAAADPPTDAPDGAASPTPPAAGRLPAALRRSRAAARGSRRSRQDSPPPGGPRSPERPP